MTISLLPLKVSTFFLLLSKRFLKKLELDHRMHSRQNDPRGPERMAYEIFLKAAAFDNVVDGKFFIQLSILHEPMNWHISIHLKDSTVWLYEQIYASPFRSSDIAPHWSKFMTYEALVDVHIFKGLVLFYLAMFDVYAYSLRCFDSDNRASSGIMARGGKYKKGANVKRDLIFCVRYTALQGPCSSVKVKGLNGERKQIENGRLGAAPKK